MKTEKSNEQIPEILDGISYIKRERDRQKNEEGFSVDGDLEYKNNELTSAAIVYAATEEQRHGFHDLLGLWPFNDSWLKLSPKDRIKELSKAGALMAADIDREIRLAELKEVKQ
jgi:hypothetical protein